MVRVSLPPTPLAEKSPDVSQVKLSRATLQKELESSSEDEARALLLYELARLAESTLDRSQAARDALAAAELVPEFTEPLELLLRIAYQSRSAPHVLQLLERLLLLAQSEPEKERVGAALAAHYLLSGQSDRLLQLLERLRGDLPHHPLIPLLHYEWSAEQRDREAQLGALEGLAQAAQNPTYRAQLFRQAATWASLAEQDSLPLLQQALNEEESFSLYRLLEREAARRGECERAQEAALQLAAICEQAARDPALQEKWQVPSTELGAPAAAQARLRALFYLLQAGQIAKARDLLGTLEEAPLTSPFFLSFQQELDSLDKARLEEATGSTQEELLAQLAAWPDLPPLDRAGVLLTQAWELAQRDPHAAELAPLLAEIQTLAPASLIASAIELHQALQVSSPERWGQQLQSLLPRLPESAAQQLRVSAALLQLRSQPQAALALLREAEQEGLPAQLAQRLFRLAGQITNSPELSLSAQLAQLSSEAEAGAPGEELLWETLRLAVLQQDPAALEQVLSYLPSGSLTHLLLTGILLREQPADGEGDSSPSPRAPLWPEALLNGAGSLPHAPALRRALLLTQCYRDLSTRGPELRSRSLGRLRSLAEQDPSDTLSLEFLAALLQTVEPALAAKIHLLLATHAVAPAVQELNTLRALFGFWELRSRAELQRTLGLVTDDPPPLLSPLLPLFQAGLSSPRGAGSPHATTDSFFAPPEDAPSLLTQTSNLCTQDVSAAWEQLQSSFAVLAAAPQPETELAQQALHFLAGLLASSQSGAALQELSGLPAASVFSAKQLALLQLEAARTSSPEQQTERAFTWLSQGNTNPDSPAETTAAALLSLYLARQSQNSALTAQALTVLGTVLQTPLLPAWAAQHLPETEATELFQKLLTTDSPEPALLWLALEHFPLHLHDARLPLVEKLSEALRAESGSADPDLHSLQLLLAYQLLKQGESARAHALFVQLVEEHPQDPSSLWGLSLAARAENKPEDEASALRALAKKCEPDAVAAELWEQAGQLYQTALQQEESAEECFLAALARQPERTSAYVLLYQSLHKRGDLPRLIELLDARLDVCSHPASRVELLWEKAQLLLQLGRVTPALYALESLLQLDEQHLPALARAAHIYLTQEKEEKAAQVLLKLARHPELPGEERQETVGLTLTLLEQLGRPQALLALLDELTPHSLSPHDFLEERAHAAVQTSAWSLAYQCFSELFEQGTDEEKKLPAAQMMLALQRDHLRRPDELHHAAEEVLTRAPLDADAIDVLLSSSAPLDKKRQLLTPALQQARQTLQVHPLHPTHIQRFIALAEATSHSDYARLGWGTLALTGRIPEDQKLKLHHTAPRLAQPREQALSPDDWARIATPEESCALGHFARLLAPTIFELTAPSLRALGCTPLMRVDPFSEHPARQEIAAWARLFELQDFDLYLGGQDPDRILVLPHKLPLILLGTNITFPLSVRDRLRLFEQLYGNLRELSIFLQLTPEESRLWMQAGLRALGKSTHTSLTEEENRRAQALLDRLPRETRDRLLQEYEQLPSKEEELLHLALYAKTSVARLCTLLHGDPSILRQLPRLIPESLEERRLFLSDVVRFSLSEDAQRLAHQLRSP